MLPNIIIFPRAEPPCCATAGICKCLGLATFVARRDGGWPECCNWCNRFLLASLASASSPRAHCFSSAVEYLRTITTPCVCCPRVYSFQRKIKRFGVFSSSCLTLIYCRYNPNLLTRRRIIAEWHERTSTLNGSATFSCLLPLKSNRDIYCVPLSQW